MKICIDVRSPGDKGIFNYARSLLNSLFRLDQTNDYMLITDPKNRTWGYDNVSEVVVPSLNPFYWLYWSNAILPRVLTKSKVDIYHSFKHVTAYFLQAKKVLTLHGGPMLYKFPEFYTWYDRMYWKFSYKKAIKSYDRIITTAASERDFFVQNQNAPAKKFRITNLAADDRFQVIEDLKLLNKVKRKYNLNFPFILFLGRIHPQKNLENLIVGYAKAKNALLQEHKLVMGGGKSGSYYEKVRKMVHHLGVSEDVSFLGNVPDEDVPVLYNLATMFLFPTNYENWGIVLLEAMACGLPVLTSTIKELDEVVGVAALRVNPTDTDEIANGICQLVNSAELRRAMRKKGLERSRLFTWDRCAQETMSAYEELHHK